MRYGVFRQSMLAFVADMAGGTDHVGRQVNHYYATAFSIRRLCQSKVIKANQINQRGEYHVDQAKV